MNVFFKINNSDNLAVALRDVSAGESDCGVTALCDIPFGHKIALCDIKRGEMLIKYGFPIGEATADIRTGEWIHTHNLKTLLSDIIEYNYEPSDIDKAAHGTTDRFFYGYERPGGHVGIRNEIWIIPTVGCVNKTAEILAAKANALFGGRCDGFFAYTHPYGCSQLGDDQAYTQKILAALAKHPNAGGVLLLGLGCENNNLESFLPLLGEYNHERIKTLITQDVEDEIAEGMKILEVLSFAAQKDIRVKMPLSRLTVGLKCGGSDAFSGITANPLCGRFADILTSAGGNIILTEVPEMFGAETILMNRAESTEVFEDIVSMVNNFKNYYKRYGQVIYENPSPGNKKGGITSLEEKSLGCIQKGGSALVRGVLEYGEHINKAGLNLLSGPGNDIVSCTALTASGANMILFTTGRGTPLGAPVPTVKISTNTALAQKKSNWIDFNAGTLIEGESFESAENSLLDFIIGIANGERSKNEQNGYREIAIFKDGVTL